MLGPNIDQIRNAPRFAVTAVEGLLTVESLLQDALRYVPYCAAHRDVWSYHFSRIILEAASQTDSVWKATTKIETPSTAQQQLKIADHFGRFGPLVERQQVAFFDGSENPAIQPFISWQQNRPPEWWTAYNKLKHDRFTYQEKATLNHAVNAVAALLLAIVYSGVCDTALIANRLLNACHYNLWAFTKTGKLRDVTFEAHTKLETKLFAHPLGIFGVDDCNLSGYWDSDSPRFNNWWALNYTSYTRPLPPRATR